MRCTGWGVHDQPRLLRGYLPWGHVLGVVGRGCVAGTRTDAHANSWSYAEPDAPTESHAEVLRGEAVSLFASVR